MEIEIEVEAEPKLAPPGAGLPKLELFIARLMFKRLLRRGNRDTFNRVFQRERELIRALAQRCDDTAAAKRVLIDRVRGIEDSSRYWSVWMTLEHLRIMHVMIARTIETLARGEVPAGKASTANMKPRPDVTGAVVEEYEKSCDRLVKIVAGIPDLNTAVRFEHPWFGMLNAAGWYAVAGMHLAIHRAQIERIVAGLKR